MGDYDNDNPVYKKQIINPDFEPKIMNLVMPDNAKDLQPIVDDAVAKDRNRRKNAKKKTDIVQPVIEVQADDDEDDVEEETLPFPIIPPHNPLPVPKPWGTTPMPSPTPIPPWPMPKPMPPVIPQPHVDPYNPWKPEKKSGPYTWGEIEKKGGPFDHQIWVYPKNDLKQYLTDKLMEKIESGEIKLEMRRTTTEE